LQRQNEAWLSMMPVEGEAERHRSSAPAPARVPDRPSAGLQIEQAVGFGVSLID